MGLFTKLKATVAGAAQRLSGKTDLLEAIAAGSILVAAADGEIEGDEVAVLIESLKAHETIAAAFSENVIESTVQKMIDSASPNAAGKIGMVGKLRLEKEVKEAKAKSSAEDIEMMLAIMVDVASADEDSIEPAEKAVINKIAASLGHPNFL